MCVSVFCVVAAVGLVVKVTVPSAPFEDNACRAFAVWTWRVVVTLAFSVTAPFRFRFKPCSWLVMSSTDCVVLVADLVDGLLSYVARLAVGACFSPVRDMPLEHARHTF